MATFNARVETVETKPFFRDAFKRTRCLIPVSGYYEWQDTPDGKQPWYFTAPSSSPAPTTAGLWDEWRDRATGEPLQYSARLFRNKEMAAPVVWTLRWAHLDVRKLLPAPKGAVVSRCQSD